MKSIDSIEPLKKSSIPQWKTFALTSCWVSHAQSVSLPLPPFTLIGATTRAGLLTRPLRDRFQIQFAMDFYEPDELSQIITKSASRLNVSMTPEAVLIGQTFPWDTPSRQPYVETC